MLFLTVNTLSAAVTTIAVDDHLETLGFSRGGDPSQDDIKKSYYKLARKWHSDKYTRESEEKQIEAKEEIQAITEANTLLNKVFEKSGSIKAYRIKYLSVPQDDPFGNFFRNDFSGRFNFENIIRNAERKWAAEEEAKRQEKVKKKNDFVQKVQEFLKKLDAAKKKTEQASNIFNFDKYLAEAQEIIHGQTVGYRRVGGLKKLFDDNQFYFFSEVSKYKQDLLYKGFNAWEKKVSKLRDKGKLTEKVTSFLKRLHDMKKKAENASSSFSREAYVEEALKLINGNSYERGLTQIFNESRFLYPEEVKQWEADSAYKNIDQWKKDLLKKDKTEALQEKIEILFKKLKEKKKEAEKERDNHRRDWYIQEALDIADGGANAYYKPENIKDLLEEFRSDIPEEVGKWEKDSRYINIDQWKTDVRSGKKPTLESSDFSEIKSSDAALFVMFGIGVGFLYKSARVHLQYKQLMQRLSRKFPGRRITKKKVWMQACDDEGLSFLLGSNYQRLDLVNLLDESFKNKIPIIS